MSDLFFERPIINSPYEYPRQHWELDDSGQPTGTLIPARRRAKSLGANCWAESPTESA